VTVTAAGTAELYRRYKALALAAGAALVLDAPVRELAGAIDELCGAAEGTPCAEPAADLRRLVQRSARGEVADADVERVRASHRRLRRTVWTTQPCEYVPCCAGAAHDH